MQKAAITLTKVRWCSKRKKRPAHRQLTSSSQGGGDSAASGGDGDYIQVSRRSRSGESRPVRCSEHTTVQQHVVQCWMRVVCFWPEVQLLTHWREHPLAFVHLRDRAYYAQLVNHLGRYQNSERSTISTMYGKNYFALRRKSTTIRYSKQTINNHSFVTC